MRKSDCKWTGIKITTSNSSIEMRDGNTWRGSGTGKFRKGAGSGMVDVGTEINDGNGREIAVGNETSHDFPSRSRPDHIFTAGLLPWFPACYRPRFADGSQIHTKLSGKKNGSSGLAPAAIYKLPYICRKLHLFTYMHTREYFSR